MAKQNNIYRFTGSHYRTPALLVEKYGATTALVWGVMYGFIEMGRGVCKVSKKTIAAKADMTKKTVLKKIRILVHDGWLKDLHPERKNDVHHYVLGQKSFQFLELNRDSEEQGQERLEQKPDDHRRNQDMERSEGCKNSTPDAQMGCRNYTPDGPVGCKNYTPGTREGCRNYTPGVPEEVEGVKKLLVGGVKISPQGCKNSTQIDKLIDLLIDPFLNQESSSSSSSAPEKGGVGGKTSDAADDAEVDFSQQKLPTLLKAAGISAQNRRDILASERIQIPDLLAELARCHDPASNVRKPHLITPMNLLQGSFPDATWYDPSLWLKHIPDRILKKAGLVGEIQKKIPDRETSPDTDQGGNGKTLFPAFDIPEKHRQSWEGARGQLQLGMAKANFESWVRDMQLISAQDQRFTFAVKNPYAREWLEERLSSTLCKLLSGSLGQDVQVDFVVQE